MSEQSYQSRSFLDIPRLPGEPKLSGVPHKRSDSLFVQEGVIDALDLSYATYELSSKRRRAELDQALARFACNKTPLSSVAAGLETVTNHAANPNFGRHAAYMGSVIADRISKTVSSQPEKELPVESGNIPIHMKVDKDYREHVLNLGPELYDPTAEVRQDHYLRQAVAALVRNNDPEEPKIIEVGTTLFHRFNNPDNSLSDALMMFANLAEAIDSAKVKSIGRKSTTHVSNQIIASAGSALVNSYPDPYKGQSELMLFRANLRIMAPNSSAWLEPKYAQIEQSYKMDELLNSYIGRFMDSKKAWRLEESLHGHAGTLRALADETIQALHKFRKYGLKPAYTNQSSPTLKSDEAWVIDDPKHILGPGNEERKAILLSVADFKLADTDKPTDLIADFTAIEHGNGGQTITAKFGYGWRLDLGMFADGELRAGSAMQLRTVRDNFERRGLNGVYEYLRLTLIRQLYDLTVPAGFVNELPGDPGPMRLPHKKRDEYSIITDIMVPRLKLLREQESEILAAIEKEHDAENRIVRREHNVVGHTVRLPSGYKPSAEAVQSALRDGVTLEPGETYRKKHTRGSKEVGVVSGNRLIDRS